MCFIVHSDYPDPLVAEQDIPCFKIGVEAKVISGRGCFTSEFRGYVYKLKKLQPEIELCPSEDYPRVINKGYHSFSPDHLMAQFPFSADSVYCLVKCIIPKGSQYYFNPHDLEYVSNQIIAQEILYIT